VSVLGQVKCYWKVGVMAKRLGNIKLNEAAFFLCDMQERFRPAIKYFNEILEVSKRLVSCHFRCVANEDG